MCRSKRTHNMLIGGIARGLRHADATPALRARTAMLGTAFQATAAASGFHATRAGTCTMVQGGIATPGFHMSRPQRTHTMLIGMGCLIGGLRYADATPTLRRRTSM
jgi:hypothetical protein